MEQAQRDHYTEDSGQETKNYQSNRTMKQHRQTKCVADSKEDREMGNCRELLDCALRMREHPDVPHDMPTLSRNPVPGNNE